MKLITNSFNLSFKSAFSKSRQTSESQTKPQTPYNQYDYIHPLVKQNFDLWLENHQNFPFVIKEAAILFESGFYKKILKQSL